MGRQESPQLIERKTQVDTDAQETSRASKYRTFYVRNVGSKQLLPAYYTQLVCDFNIRKTLIAEISKAKIASNG